jgi:hypothetical protein
VVRGQNAAGLCSRQHGGEAFFEVRGELQAAGASAQLPQSRAQRSGARVVAAKHAVTEAGDAFVGFEFCSIRRSRSSAAASASSTSRVDPGAPPCSGPANEHYAATIAASTSQIQRNLIANLMGLKIQ